MTWTRSPTALWRRTPLHVVAAAHGSAEPQVLAGIARDVWDALELGATTDEVTAAIGADARPTLTELAAAGLVQGGTSGGPALPGTPGPAPGPAPGAAPDPAAPSRPAAPPSLLAGAMTFWLPGGPDPITTVPLAPEPWDELMASARRERCFGPLCWAVASGALASTPDQREEVERYAILGAHSAIAQEAELLDVSAWLDGAGIELRVLKGSATRHLDHLDPSFRASADLDLLVRPDALDAAVEVLAGHGYRRELPERRTGFDARFGKDVTLQHDHRVEVDLHRLPLAGALGLSLDLDALWAEADLLEIGGRRLLALDPAGRFLHAAWSLALTDPVPRLVPALDLVAIALRHQLEPARLDALAPIGHGRAALRTAVEQVEALLGPAARALLPPLALPAPTRSEQRRLRAYPGQGGSKARYLIGGGGSLRSNGERLAYLGALLVPSGEYRRARRAHLRRPEWRIALRDLVRSRRPSP